MRNQIKTHNFAINLGILLLFEDERNNLRRRTFFGKFYFFLCYRSANSRRRNCYVWFISNYISTILHSILYCVPHLLSHNRNFAINLGNHNGEYGRNNRFNSVYVDALLYEFQLRRSSNYRYV